MSGSTVNYKANERSIESLKRLLDENERQHEAFLLWAMQAPAKRSVRQVGKAFGCSESNVRAWTRKKEWDRRVALASKGGMQSDAAAAYLHAQEYASKRDHVLGDPVSGRPGVVGNMRPEVKYGDVAFEAATADKISELANEAQRAREDERAQIRQLRGAFRGIAIRTITEFGRALGGKELVTKPDGTQEVVERPCRVRFAASDLGKLHEVLSIVQDPTWTREDDAPKNASGPTVIESVRVRHARARGESIVQAALDDVEDLRVILVHLQRGGERELPATVPVAGIPAAGGA